MLLTIMRLAHCTALNKYYAHFIQSLETVTLVSIDIPRSAIVTSISCGDLSSRRPSNTSLWPLLCSIPSCWCSRWDRHVHPTWPSYGKQCLTPLSCETNPGAASEGGWRRSSLCTPIFRPQHSVCPHGRRSPRDGLVPPRTRCMV